MLWTRGSSSTILLNFTTSLLNSLAFSPGTVRAPSASSTTIAFRPFAPITAPGPPRAACRVGRPSGSVTATEAEAMRCSPAGPIVAAARVRSASPTSSRWRS